MDASESRVIYEFFTERIAGGEKRNHLRLFGGSTLDPAPGRVAAGRPGRTRVVGELCGLGVGRLGERLAGAQAGEVLAVAGPVDIEADDGHGEAIEDGGVTEVLPSGVELDVGGDGGGAAIEQISEHVGGGRGVAVGGDLAEADVVEDDKLVTGPAAQAGHVGAIGETGVELGEDHRSGRCCGTGRPRGPGGTRQRPRRARRRRAAARRDRRRASAAARCARAGGRARAGPWGGAHGWRVKLRPFKKLRSRSQNERSVFGLSLGASSRHLSLRAQAAVDRFTSNAYDLPPMLARSSAP